MLLVTLRNAVNSKGMLSQNVSTITFINKQVVMSRNICRASNYSAPAVKVKSERARASSSQAAAAETSEKEEDSGDSPETKKQASAEQRKGGQPGQRKKRSQKPSSSTSNIQERLIQVLDDTNDNKSHRPDEDEMFLLSLLPTLRSFNDEEKMLVKMRLQSVLFEMKYKRSAATEHRVEMPPPQPISQQCHFEEGGFTYQQL